MGGASPQDRWSGPAKWSLHCLATVRTRGSWLVTRSAYTNGQGAGRTPARPPSLSCGTCGVADHIEVLDPGHVRVGQHQPDRRVEQRKERTRGDPSLATFHKIAAIRELQDEFVRRGRTVSRGGVDSEFRSVLFEQPYCRISTVMTRCGVSRPAATSWLGAFAEAGLLQDIKVGRGRLLANREFLQLLVRAEPSTNRLRTDGREGRHLHVSIPADAEIPVM